MAFCVKLVEGKWDEVDDWDATGDDNDDSEDCDEDGLSKNLSKN